MSDQLALLPEYLTGSSAALSSRARARSAGERPSRRGRDPDRLARATRVGGGEHHSNDPEPRAPRGDGAGARGDQPAEHRFFAGLHRPHAVQYFAHPAEHGHWYRRRRPRAHRSRSRRGHDTEAAAVPRGASARSSGHRCRPENLRSLDRRYRNALDARGRDEPRELHLQRASNPKTMPPSS